MSHTKTLTAREAYHDSLQFFEEIKQNIGHGIINDKSTVSFTEKLEPEEDFQIRLKATHATLAMFVKRYRAAEFTFHTERAPIDGYPETARQNNPLVTHYAEFTVDFTPYGTIFGGHSDDNGGNATKQTCSSHRDGNALTGPTGPATPDTPTGPMAEQTSAVQSLV
ncbi:hypothetical protein [Halorubrum sp. AJ67]|uniref:hypothetical protein n=1 Tax=Halorubrum sp. AJ67 TaxID=1173487 RepID=UPI0003DDA662|nr:hypothetical protein [Halorubrum sp. AJ67]CDK38152.1 hypothetical protein BN903_352 [Halorubrum sp. AJ67]